MPGVKRPRASDTASDTESDALASSTTEKRTSIRIRTSVHFHNDPFNMDPPEDEQEVSEQNGDLHGRYVFYHHLTNEEDGDGDGDECDNTSSSEADECDYPEHLSVGSEDSAVGTEWQELEIVSDVDLQQETSGIDEDERYARLLQQQEIALARHFGATQIPEQSSFLAHLMLQTHPEETDEEAEGEGEGEDEEEEIDMSYESLLQLQENIGEVKRRGLTDSSLRLLSRDVYRREKASGFALQDHACPVCMTEYEEGETTLRLPCKHFFHSTCVETWLSRSASCPVCRELVPEIVEL